MFPAHFRPELRYAVSTSGMCKEVLLFYYFLFLICEVTCSRIKDNLRHLISRPGGGAVIKLVFWNLCR
jgi:hypothetical protein